MLGMTRWNSIDDFFTFQRQLETVFDQFWNELPSRTAAGHTLTIRAEQLASSDAGAARYEQSFTVPQFLDLEKISASSHAASTLKASQTRDRSRRPRNTLVLM